MSIRSALSRHYARRPGDLPAVKQDQVRGELRRNDPMQPKKKRWKGDAGIKPRDPKGVPRTGGGHAPERRWY